MKSGINDIRKELQKGFYIDNLKEMVGICGDLMKKDNPLVFYVIQSIFYDIVENWGGRPVTVIERGIAESYLVESINKVLDLVEKKSEDGLLIELNNLVEKYVKFLDENIGRV